MPELPEVETVLRTLETQIGGEEIVSVIVRYPKIVEADPDEFAKRLCGRHFLGFQRRGKYLLFQMEDVTLVSHLRMEGKYYILSREDPVDRHTHVIFQLGSGRELRYHDTRKFGRMELWPKEFDLNGFHGLGPEPFADAFSAGYLYHIAHERRVPVKTLLLDQSVVAGIGNIYADEICFAVGLRPGMSARRLTKPQCERIVNETRRILNLAIQAGGTTIRSYTSSLGVTGLFQLDCMVHARKTCSKCGENTKIKTIGGRTSYYCPCCQK